MARLVVAGAINWDINLFVDKLPELGEEVPVKEVTRVPGGKGANVAVAAARLLGPGRVHLFGALGGDPEGEEHLEILRQEGVETRGVKRSREAPSGRAYITVDAQGSNTIATHFGANLDLRVEDVEKPIWMEELGRCEAVVVLDPPLDTGKRLVGLAEGGGKTVFFSPGVLSEGGLGALRQIIEEADYLIANEMELSKIAGGVEWRESMKLLSPLNRELKLVVMRGARGCALLWGGGGLALDAIPIEKIGYKPTNTVGCGDAFIGAFASARVMGLTEVEALWWGNVAGAVKAARKDTRGSPGLQELEERASAWDHLRISQVIL